MQGGDRGHVAFTLDQCKGPWEYIYASQDMSKDRIQMCHWRVGRWQLFTFFPSSSTCGGEWAGLKLKHLCQPAAIISHGSKASPDRDTATAVPLRLAPPPRWASVRSVTQVCHMPARRASWQMSHLACKRVQSPQHIARGQGQCLRQWHKWAETAVAGDTYGNANAENTRKVWMKLWGCEKNKNQRVYILSRTLRLSRVYYLSWYILKALSCRLCANLWAHFCYRCCDFDCVSLICCFF